MSVPPSDTPVGSFEVRCRVGQFVMDSDDPDRVPDLVALGGRVTIEPDLNRPIRVNDSTGTRVVGVDPLEFTIDTTTGQLVHPDGDPGVELIDPTDEHLDPQGWTYTATVRPAKGRFWTVTFGAPADGSVVDLGSIASVAPSPGITANYLQQTVEARDQAESFAVRAETAADEAEGYAPTFAWDGTALSIDGGDPVDLKGEQGTTAWDDLTGKPTSFPSTVADVDGVVVDTSAGTRVSIGGVAVFYDSGWRVLCRWSDGEVTQGVLPSGLAPRGNTAGGIFIRRYPTTVSIAVVEANVITLNPRISLPSGFRGTGRTGVPYPAVPIYYRDANLDAKIANAEFGVGFVRFRDVPAGATLSAAGTGGYGVTTTVPSENDLPTSLPGTPA